MKNKKLFLGIIIILFLSLFLILVTSNVKKTKLNDFQPVSENNKINFIKIGDKKIKVELATTEKEQARGLSGRNGLVEDTGMLFIFDKIAKYSFWMKEMNFPIDMIWISEDLHIVYIKNNAQPASYPEDFTPSTDAKYVLEINAGFSEKNNLTVGNFVQFSP